MVGALVNAAKSRFLFPVFFLPLRRVCEQPSGVVAICVKKIMGEGASFKRSTCIFVRKANGTTFL